MEVKLGVLTAGKWMGKLIPITVLPFLIGRARECHLRPASAKISQRHCALLIEGVRLFVRDFNSTIGTLVNGERVHGTAELQDRDLLKVGPLEFLVYIGSSTSAHGAIPERPPGQETAEEAAAGLLLAGEDEGIVEDLAGKGDGTPAPAARPGRPARAGGAGGQASSAGKSRVGPPASAAPSPRWTQLPAPPLGVKVEEGGDAIVVKITIAELLEARPIRTLRTYLELLAKAGTNLKIVLSLEAVESMDSTFLSAVIDLDRNVKEAGGKLAICQLRPETEAIFKALELGQVLNIFKNEGEAAQALQGKA